MRSSAVPACFQAKPFRSSSFSSSISGMENFSVNAPFFIPQNNPMATSTNRLMRTRKSEKFIPARLSRSKSAGTATRPMKKEERNFSRNVILLFFRSGQPSATPGTTARMNAMNVWYAALNSSAAMKTTSLAAAFPLPSLRQRALPFFSHPHIKT
ncbi:Uncharacterised protein [uncultured archaeon]|nr:Uncharacterised protein [uncultured archaeon]